MDSTITKLLGKEFGYDEIVPPQGNSLMKIIKERIKETASDLDLDPDIVKHFTEMRKHGKIALAVPYRNRGEHKVIELVKLRARSFEISERVGHITFDLFAMDVGDEKGKCSDWVFKASRLLPEADCNDITNIVKAFYSHNVFGYFSIIDDPDLNDKEIALLALFLQNYIKEQFNLHVWMCTFDMSSITDKMVMSPYLLSFEKVPA